MEEARTASARRCKGREVSSSLCITKTHLSLLVQTLETKRVGEGLRRKGSITRRRNDFHAIWVGGAFEEQPRLVVWLIWT